jgi:hypothetical protein
VGYFDTSEVFLGTLEIHGSPSELSNLPSSNLPRSFSKTYWSSSHTHWAKAGSISVGCHWNFSLA